MAMTQAKIRHLTLVSSRPPLGADAVGTSDQERQAEPWRQLDLFAENPRTVIFVSPDECKLADVLELLKSAHIKQIFDIREMPHLVFEGQSRAGFFDVLDRVGISYMSSLEFEAKNSGSKPFVVARELALKLKAGPTMVFSDRNPESDPEVAKIHENFTKDVKGYKSVFFSIGTR